MNSMLISKDWYESALWLLRYIEDRVQQVDESPLMELQLQELRAGESLFEEYVFEVGAYDLRSGYIEFDNARVLFENGKLCVRCCCGSCVSDLLYCRHVIALLNIIVFQYELDQYVCEFDTENYLYDV